jgi:hypothetical protein
MNILIQYYTLGIGTTKSEVMAENWKRKLEEIRNPSLDPPRQNDARPPLEKVPMQFFAGYSANLIAPVGVTVGGIGRSVGWYLRLRSNLSFQDYLVVCDEEGIIPPESGIEIYKRSNVRKTNTFIGTGGIMIKVDPSFYISVGAGYCSHEVLYRYERIDDVEPVSLGEFWAKVDKSSFSGIALDLDGTFKIAKSFYGSIGCSVLNISAPKVYLNAGFGLFF